MIYACHFPFDLANRITELLVWVSLDPLMTDHEKLYRLGSPWDKVLPRGCVDGGEGGAETSKMSLNLLLFVLAWKEVSLRRPGGGNLFGINH